MWTGTIPRRRRWLVPAGALLATGAIIGGMQLPLAQAAAPLPAKSPAQLIAWTIRAWEKPADRALSGTITESASLGIPQLPGMQNQRSLLSLLSGDHTINVWIASTDRFRVQFPARMSETDLYDEGGTAWLWDSAANTATRLNVGPQSGSATYGDIQGSDSAYQSTVTMQADDPVPPTPEEIAQYILQAVGPTTLVGTNPDILVAGRSAYELEIAPRSSQSTIGSVRIDVDGQNATPLRVQIYAKGATAPAFSIGFTSVTFAKPSTTDISFTPPPGAHITKPGQSGTQSPTMPQFKPGDFGLTGQGWLAVAKLPASILDAISSPAGAAQPVTLGGGAGDQAFAIKAALAAATPVHGSWGSGKLLHTSLVNVLITDSGSMYIGAVVPDLLYAAAAQPAANGWPVQPGA